MFDMGFFELLVVFVIALLVLGPERLPKVARKVGYWSGRARATFSNLRYELEREVHNQDMQETFRRKAKELGIDEASLSGHIEFDPLADSPSISPPAKIAPPEETAQPTKIESSDQSVSSDATGPVATPANVEEELDGESTPSKDSKQ